VCTECALLSVALLARGCFERALLGAALGRATGSACEASGESEDAARRSSSSSLRFSFLPAGMVSRMKHGSLGTSDGNTHGRFVAQYGFEYADAL
jgi:hypothetical protein